MKRSIIILYVLLLSNFGLSQSVGIGTPSPDAAAALDIFSNNKGVLIPRVTSAVRQTMAVGSGNGLLVYDMDSASFWYYGDGDWHEISSSINEAWKVKTPDTVWTTRKVLVGDYGNAASSAVFEVKSSSKGILIPRMTSLQISSIVNPETGLLVYDTNQNLFYYKDPIDWRAISGSLWETISSAYVEPRNDKWLRVTKFDNTPAADIKIGAGNGGLVSVYDAGINERVKIIGSNPASVSSGLIEVFNSTGAGGVKISGSNPTVPNSGLLEIFDATNTSAIKLWGDHPTSTKSRIVSQEVEILGGSDLAEYFDIDLIEKDKIRPGMLVSADDVNIGKVTITKQALDKKVVGVISGANNLDPGLIMGQKNSIAFGDHPIALAGRVFVLCTNEQEINVGDMLTSSKKHGFATKVKNYNKSRGAIIGKALSKRDPATGFVLTLVNLQ
jgi:hypothetical protein